VHAYTRIFSSLQFHPKLNRIHWWSVPFCL